jgi:imidazole glycerol-phosphate synthase subunit HisF
MLRPRIIPCQLVKNGGLVKTVRFTDDRYVGDPVNAVKILNEKEADELIVVDIDAATKAVEPNFKLIAQIAVECRMPLCYGGGIRTVDHASKTIGLGVEKIAVSSAGLEDPSLITAIVREVGSQSVVVVFDVNRRPDGTTYDVRTHNGRRATGKVVIDLVSQAASWGAGRFW